MIGHLVFDERFTKKEHLNRLYQSNLVDVVYSNGSLEKNVLVPSNLISLIQVPKKKSDLGSCVFVVKSEQVKIVLAILEKRENNNLLLENDNDFILSKLFKDSGWYVKGEADENGEIAKIIFNAYSNKNATSTSGVGFYFHTTSNFNIHANSVNFYSVNRTEIKSSKTIDLILTKEDDENEISKRILFSKEVLEFSDEKNKLSFDEKGVKLESEEVIEIRAGESGSQPSLLGNDTISSISEIISKISDICDKLANYATVQNTVALNIPVITGLSPGYTKLGAQMSILKLELKVLDEKLEKNKSKKVKIN